MVFEFFPREGHVSLTPGDGKDIRNCKGSIFWFSVPLVTPSMDNKSSVNCSDSSMCLIHHSENAQDGKSAAFSDPAEHLNTCTSSAASAIDSEGFQGIISGWSTSSNESETRALSPVTSINDTAEHQTKEGSHN